MVNIQPKRGGTQHGLFGDYGNHAENYTPHGAPRAPAIPPAIEIAGFLAEWL
jgi:hypothetical protein